MSYLVLARKFRPQSFADVSGQEHVTKTLGNSIRRGKIAHAYLLAGPRGVGKTSIARILAKSLNCQQGPTVSPCMSCSNCKDITAGNSLAVREIDGASHNSVDNVRDLIDSFRALPPPGSRYKVYIIDEVHMLSLAAFNALLKSLEEPPPNTVFILATTESHKIPDTVISRCQRHDLRALTQEEVEQRLAHICQAEKIESDADALRLVARLSEGSMRDAQSLLDRVHSFCDGRISAAEASKVLGVVERSMLFRLSALVFARDAAAALTTVQEAFTRGLNPALFLKEFAAHWRELLIAKIAGDSVLTQIGVSAPDRTELLQQVSNCSQPDIQDLAERAREGADQAIRSAYPRYAIESLIVRLALRQPVKDVAELVSLLKSVVRSSAGDSGKPAARVPVPSTNSSVPQRDNVAGLRLAGQSTSAAQVRGNSPVGVSSSSVPRASIVPMSAVPLSSEGGAAVAAQVEPIDNAPEEPANNVSSKSWEDFVRFVASSVGGKILAEQLKRLSPIQFSSGKLNIRGPEFSVSYLSKADIRARLTELLKNFSPDFEWSIEISASKNAAAAEAGSLRHSEEEEKRNGLKEKNEAILNHPSIKSIQKIFPGSKIEKIKHNDPESL